MDEMDAAPGDAFVLRPVRTAAHARPRDPAGRGVDADRVWRGDGARCAAIVGVEVRLITLTRPGQESVRVVTSLLDGRCPAHDILEAYLARWGIETVFQQITEVFGLARAAPRPRPPSTGPVRDVVRRDPGSSNASWLPAARRPRRRSRARTCSTMSNA
ncbi:MAG: hypothetical protein R3B68_00480 [Phycisphaerales bacterium]